MSHDETQQVDALTHAEGSQSHCDAGGGCAGCGDRCVIKSTMLASVGVLCVGLGGVGVVVPGLPTTVFLIVACWCFARSSPWLEQRLVRIPLFAPFLSAVDGKGGMPRRAKLISVSMLWVGMSASVAWLLLSDAPPWLPPVVLVSGFLGTYWIAYRVPGEASCAARHGLHDQSVPVSITVDRSGETIVEAKCPQDGIVMPTSSGLGAQHGDHPVAGQI